jgi:putative two-component system response regulator
MNRVLMVDDSDVNLAVYRGALHGLRDIDITMETVPRLALEHLSRERFDVIILDFHMPEIDGLTFLQRIVETDLACGALVVMITAERDHEVRHRALELGAADFLTKPIDRIELQARMKNLLKLVTAQRRLSDRAIQLRYEIEQATKTIRDREMDTIMRLTRAAEFRDSTTGMHVVRVGEMCAALAATMGLPEAEVELLRLAAPMHDVGKVATPDGILLKPGKLTSEEFEIMKAHALAGYEILRGSDSPMLQLAAEIALSHHERFDGSGYPNGIAGTAIPLSGRLCSIVDVFDALTSERPYKRAWPIEEALLEIRKGSGAHFDPDIVAVFFQAKEQVLDINRRYRDGLTAA